MTARHRCPLRDGEETFVAAEPYPWPYDGNLRAANTALIVIDMQTDFCGVGGYVDKMGYDLSLTRAPIEPIKALMARMRDARLSRSSTRAKAIGPTSPTCRPTSAGARARSAERRRHRRPRPVRPHPRARRAGLGHHPRARAAAGEIVIDKPGKGSFCATDLELLLHTRGIRNLLLAGITTDVCVHTTMRDANDRGFECVLLTDCTRRTDRGNHLAAIKMVPMQGGVFGAVAPSARCWRRWRDVAPSPRPSPGADR